MKTLAIILIILVAGVGLADDSLFVSDSMFVYYSKRGNAYLAKYQEDINRNAAYHGYCLQEYAKALDAVNKMIHPGNRLIALAKFQLGNAILRCDTLWNGYPYVPNWRQVQHLFSGGSFNFTFAFYRKGLSKEDQKKLLAEFEPYYKAYIWLYIQGGDSEQAMTIRRKFERYK